MMKLSLFFIAATALGAPLAVCSETNANRPDYANQAKRAPQNPHLRAIPIQDYWNANSWDQTGGSLFWHDLSEKRREAMSQRNSKKSPTPAAAPNRDR